VILVSLAFVGPASAQKQWTVTGQDVPELEAIDQMVRTQMQEFDIRASSVAVAKDGRLVYARGYTWDAPGVEPVQPTSLFRIYSIAKSITSIAIHKLIEDGLLSYQTPVAATLDLEPQPPWRADHRLSRVTVDHLLTHTVGWDRYGAFGIDPLVFKDEFVAGWLGVAPPPTRREVATFMAGVPFQFEPGTRWGYCNVGYLLLQMLAEQATGQDFPQYIFDNVFRPIGVGRARVSHMLESDLAPTERDYTGDYQGDPYAFNVENLFAAGGMVMAAPDLARLYSVLFDTEDAGGLLKQQTIDSMLSYPFSTSRDEGYGRGWVHEKYFLDSGHTLGWLTEANDDAVVYGHGGGGPGAHTLAVWHSDGITFVWLTNKDPFIEEMDDFPVIDSWPDHDLWESVGISKGPAGSAPVESWIPMVAHADGVGGSSWRSDVGLLNRSPVANRIRLRYRDGDGFTDREFVLAPGAARTVSDVVSELGRHGSGPLQVFSSEALTVSSRSFNQTPDGSYGQFLDAVTATGGLEQGESAVLMQLREDHAYRTNIGLHNQWRRAAELEIVLYAGSGDTVASFTRIVPAQSTVQLNRPYRAIAGRSDISSGYAVVTVLSGQDVYAYGSVADNATDDPTTIPMLVGVGATRQWMAAAAHDAGANGSQWRTDLCLLNLSTAAADVDLVFRGDGGDSTGRSIVLLAGEQLLIEDVVSELGMQGSGSVELSANRPILASSRTHNLGEDGSFGQFIGGASPTETVNAGATVWLPQLRHDDRFRTNIGALNTGAEDARITIRLFDEHGIELGSRQKRLAPGRRVQFQEPFSRIAGRSDLTTAYATVTVSEGGGVLVYGSVADRITNDPTTIWMKR
jgi:N-acyl-D-amino-acid deacylase